MMYTHTVQLANLRQHRSRNCYMTSYLANTHSEHRRKNPVQTSLQQLLNPAVYCQNYRLAGIARTWACQLQCGLITCHQAVTVPQAMTCIML